MLSGAAQNRLVVDDPHHPGDMYRDASRERAVTCIRGSLFSRLDNPAKDAIVIADARVHMDDITGVLPDPDRGDDIPRPKVEEASQPPVPDYSMFTSRVRV